MMMRRLGRVVLTLVWLGSCAALARADVRAGALGTLNWAGYSIGQPHGRLHVGYGGILEYRRTATFSIVLEPMYLGKGWKHFGLPEERLAYLEVPVLAKMSSSKRLWERYWMVGLAPARLLNAEREDETSGEVSDSKADFKSYDVGIVFGIGSTVAVGRARLLAELKYSRSLSGIMANESGGGSGGKHTGILLSVGVMIGGSE